MTIILPYPPSVNHYWRHFRGRFCVSAEGKRYRQNVAMLIAGERLTKPFTSAVCVSIEVWPPDKRRRDLDNILKALLDALQTANVYNNDSQIEDIHIFRSKSAPIKGGQVKVNVWDENGE